MAQSWLDLNLAPKLVRQVCIYGTGHLAASTRLELRRFGVLRENEYALPQLLPPLIIACADFDGDPIMTGAALRATDMLAPLLLATLCVPTIRIGPLVEPGPAAGLPGVFTTSDTSYKALFPLASPSSTAKLPEPDIKTSLCARVGGLLIAGQALSFLQGARNQCVLDRLVEVSPLSIESKAYQVLKVRH